MRCKAATTPHKAVAAAQSAADSPLMLATAHQLQAYACNPAQCTATSRDTHPTIACGGRTTASATLETTARY
ncbi:MAG: hypothetical protein ACI4BC_07960 [Muribaculaceae bacterium]